MHTQTRFADVSTKTLKYAYDINVQLDLTSPIENIFQYKLGYENLHIVFEGSSDFTIAGGIYHFFIPYIPDQNGKTATIKIMFELINPGLALNNETLVKSIRIPVLNRYSFNKISNPKHIAYFENISQGYLYDVIFDFDSTSQEINEHPYRAENVLFVSKFYGGLLVQNQYVYTKYSKDVFLLYTIGKSLDQIDRRKIKNIFVFDVADDYIINQQSINFLQNNVFYYFTSNTIDSDVLINKLRNKLPYNPSVYNNLSFDNTAYDSIYPLSIFRQDLVENFRYKLKDEIVFAIQLKTYTTLNLDFFTNNEVILSKQIFRNFLAIQKILQENDYENIQINSQALSMTDSTVIINLTENLIHEFIFNNIALSYSTTIINDISTATQNQGYSINSLQVSIPNSGNLNSYFVNNLPVSIINETKKEIIFSTIKSKETSLSSIKLTLNLAKNMKEFQIIKEQIDAADSIKIFPQFILLSYLPIGYHQFNSINPIIEGAAFIALSYSIS